MILAAGLGAAWLQSAAAAESTPALKDEKEKLSYSLGLNTGKMLKQGHHDIDVDIFAAAMKDVLAGREPKLTDQEVKDVIAAYQKEWSAKREEERRATAEKNRKEGEAFLAENKKKEGIRTHEVKLPDGTTNEFQYKVLTEGTGPTPKTTDWVSVNFRGTTIDGKEFESTAKTGQTGRFPLTRVPYRGLSEALQMMKVGSKWEVFLPSALGFGEFGNPMKNIEPGATLIFEVELVKAEEPPPPASPAPPLTSDIIRVPSAEGLKKGEKIETIKAEDAERMAREAAATNKVPK